MRNVNRFQVVRAINYPDRKCMKNSLLKSSSIVIRVMTKLKIETGYLYHIKDEFFDLVNNNGLMINHENGKGRPTYLTILDGEFLWFIPISSKVSKYQEIIDKKIKNMVAAGQF